MNTLLLNVSTREDIELAGTIENTQIANAVTGALELIQTNSFDTVMINVDLEFGSTDALIYISQFFRGKIIAFGESITSATQQMLNHLGISAKVGKFSELISQLDTSTSNQAFAAVA